MRNRRGFTLIEVLVALVIMLIVTGAIYKLLNTSQRLSLAQAERVSLQSNVRTGSLVVPTSCASSTRSRIGWPDARTTSRGRSPTDITYRAMRGIGFVCQAPTATEIRRSRLPRSQLDRPPDSAGATGTASTSSSMATRTTTATIPGLQVAITAVASPNTLRRPPGDRLTVAPARRRDGSAGLRTPVRLLRGHAAAALRERRRAWLARGPGQITGDGPPAGARPPDRRNGLGLEYLDAAGGGRPPTDGHQEHPGDGSRH